MHSKLLECFDEMSLPILKNAFYFVPLRIGNIVLGLVGTVVYCVIWIYLIIIRYSHRLITTHDTIIYGIVNTIVIVLSIIHSIGCAAFVVGIVKKNSRLILPWLFSQIIITAYLVLSCILLRPSPKMISFVFNGVLLHAYVWLCGYSIYERIRTRGTKHSLIPSTLSDKYNDMFLAISKNESNRSQPQTKIKCNSVEIKIHKNFK